MKKILYQGLPGSNSYTVAVRLFGKNASLTGRVERFKKICEEFVHGDYDNLVLPIENTLAGSVYENYDNLYSFPLHVIGEVSLRIEHYLLSRAYDVSQIAKVYSHPKALEQCELFFEQHPQIEELVVQDTAGAAKLVSETNDGRIAAIASPQVAQLYHLPVLQKNIEDDHRNYTRFFVVSKTGEHNSHANKASVIFSTSHKPGSLFHALKTFADHRLNLTKIESRPLPDNPFEYFFYVDFEFDTRHREVAEEAVSELSKHTRSINVLGYYVKDSHERIQ